MELLRREEKQENVDRIQRADNYQKKKIKMKIDFDMQRGESILKTKQEYMETRI